jgi:hypothetical protein
MYMENLEVIEYILIYILYKDYHIVYAKVLLVDIASIKSTNVIQYNL